MGEQKEEKKADEEKTNEASTENLMPVYKPTHILDPNYEGTSDYEKSVFVLLREKKERLQYLKESGQGDPQEIKKLEEDISALETLHENYYLGMNVFRNARGGREGLRE